MRSPGLQGVSTKMSCLTMQPLFLPARVPSPVSPVLPQSRGLKRASGAQLAADARGSVAIGGEGQPADPTSSRKPAPSSTSQPNPFAEEPTLRVLSWEEAEAAVEALDLPEDMLVAARRLGSLLLDAHLGTVVRLAYESPFEDLRERLRALLDEMRRLDVNVPDLEQRHLLCSVFVPPGAVLPISPSALTSATMAVAVAPDLLAEAHALFETIFLETGRVSHMDRLLGWHPQFLERFYITKSMVMRGDGPLPITWRYYLALMAVSRFRCEYLFDLLEREYLDAGGERAWLVSLQNAEPKLAHIVEMNAYLAHMPWKLSQSHIAQLVRHGHWSVNEVTHAAVILVTYHGLCGLVYGLGVTPELDTHVLDTRRAAIMRSAESQDNVASGDSVSHETDRLIQRLTGEASSEDERDESGSGNVDQFALAGDEEGNMSSPNPDDEDEAEASEEQSRLSQFDAISGRFPLKYENFDVRSEFYDVFRTHDYSWKEHGVALVNQLYPGAGTAIDEELDLIYNLTYRNVLDKEDVDTTPFRRGVWFYTQRLFGVCHDDYQYANVNRYVGKTTKAYVKKLVCHPEDITKQNFDNCGLDLRPDEKIHLALLALESRKQSSMLHALHAIMKYMS